MQKPRHVAENQKVIIFNKIMTLEQSVKAKVFFVLSQNTNINLT